MTGGIDMSRLLVIATVAHEANRAWCATHGDFSQVAWADAPQWQRDSALLGVEFILSNPDAGDSALHDNWAKDKANDGWVYGATKDVDAKTHPCMVPFEDLPDEQQAKDRLFRSVVTALAENAQ